MKITAIIVAAGRGIRAGGDTPKQWQPLAGRRVIDHTIAAFATNPLIDDIVVVLNADDLALADSLAPQPLKVVQGGATRSASVAQGLKASHGADAVLIHDAARPCVSAAVIDEVVSALESASAAAPALPVTDALWHGAQGQVGSIANRDGLFAAQTPQGFHLGALMAAHDANTADAADDVAIARAAGMRVMITQGSPDNIKITGPEDFARAASILEKQMDIRCGNGFDVHAFGPGDYVVLCGVKIPHDQGLVGHSDADVGLHTLADAIYGALAKGDIGQHFPPSDPKWKGAESHVFLRHAAQLARDDGYTISNLDCTLMCEHPKIGPHSAQMRASVAQITGLDVSRVSVKATTTEKLGFTGRGEGIACMATVTLVKP